MKDKKRIAVYVIYIVVGIALLAAGIAELVDEFWSGMGSGLMCVGILQLIRRWRLRRDDSYREKFEIAQTDERNRFIRNKAWAWAGYLFILIAGLSVIVLKVMGQEQLSKAASCAGCLILVLYWGSYMVLSRKY